MATLQMDQAMADKMVDKAVLFCADKKFAGDIDQTLQSLRRGRCDVCEYLTYSLVRQIGEYLGQIDRTVKAVYAFDREKAPMTLHARSQTVSRRASGINLVAWVDRKSAALSSLNTTLESVLAESRHKLGCVNAKPACFNLDMQMVDDREVQEGRGLGAVVQSMYVRSIQVWTRVDQIDRAELPAISERHPIAGDLVMTFNPELAPEEMLFEQAMLIEKMQPAARVALELRFKEEMAILIRRIISDQSGYINIAKDWFSVSDLVRIRRRKIGEGKIGGKSAGLLLAECILNKVADESLKTSVRIPESYYLGSDLIYIFMSANGLTHWNDQKYKPEEQIRADYPRIQEEFQAGEFPPDIQEKLGIMLDEIGPVPVIARSSSQLEDNFGTSFAGKYNSYFCPNQGTPQENLLALTRAIALTYASTLKPEALLYRRSKGLQDYDERMAILIQAVQGERFGRYFFPFGAGVAFSRNLYRWSPEIRREDGFARLVWGLGTRAVERVGNDYPHLVALSHPNLLPDDSCEAIHHYSQHYIDLIDLQDNVNRTLPVDKVLKPNYPALRHLAQIEQEGYFTSLRSRIPEADIPRLAITFSEFLRRTPFASQLSKMLRLLEQHYHGLVDIEFTVQIPDVYAQPPEAIISLLQCRPQSHLEPSEVVHIPEGLSPDQILFSTRFMVPQGHVTGIRYVLFISPEEYFGLPTASERGKLGRAVARLNSVLPDKSFICVGPGRWGTTNPDLGVYVSYADVHRAAALVELSNPGIGIAPEPSLGTHFFHDLMEARIYPLAIHLDCDDVVFNQDFFYKTPDCLSSYVGADLERISCLRLIDVANYRPGHHLELVMDDEQSQAIAFLSQD